jgi:hypothetical protein
MTTVQTSEVSDSRHKKIVHIELNGGQREIPAGDYTGRTLKLLLGIQYEHELDQVIHHEFKPVANDQELRIKGGEKFVSHCGQGQSS